MRKSVAVLLSIVSLFCFGGEREYRLIHRVFGIEAEKLDTAMEAYAGAFSDGLILAAFNQMTIGPTEAKDFTNQCAFVKRMQGRGVDIQICLSSTIGHTDDWTVPGGWPTMVGSDGKIAKAVACPRAAKFREYLCATARKYAGLKPSVIWLDDDFRMSNHPPIDHGCFCETCLARFGDETGIVCDRAGLKKALLEDKIVNGKRVREAWRDYNRRALTELAGAVADAVHTVDDSIAIGFMVCNPRGQLYASPDLKAWIERVRNRNGAVWFRHGSGVYDDYTPYGIVEKNIEIARLVAATEGAGIVNVTEEVTYPYTRRVKSMRMTFLELALNLGLAGADGTTFDAIKPNLDEQLKPDSVVAEINRRHPELDRMHALICGKRQIGIAAPALPDGKFVEGPVKTLNAMCPAGEETWRKLVYLGIPFTFRSQFAVAKLPAGISRGDPLAFARGKEIKDELDRLCGGRMPSRLDSVLRMGQSVWESPDGKERVVFLFNLDYDDATDVKFRENGEYSAEVLRPDGSWQSLGDDDEFVLSTIPAWSVRVLRLKK